MVRATDDRNTDVSQSGASPATILNMATLSQIGDTNTINLTQTLISGATAGNMSTINQAGNGNAATVTQTNGMTF